MQYLAVVVSIVMFFRCLGGVFALTIVSSVVNNKLSTALAVYFPSGLSSSAINSLDSIQSLPPSLLTLVQNAFSDAVRWAYIALLPFASLATIGALFLREVHIERSSRDRATRTREKRREDSELGQVVHNQATTHRPRQTIFGPFSLIIWCLQAIGDRMGWRK